MFSRTPRHVNLKAVPGLGPTSTCRLCKRLSTQAWEATSLRLVEALGPAIGFYHVH